MYLKLQTLGVGAARRRHRSLGKKLCDLLNVHNNSLLRRSRGLEDIFLLFPL